MFGSSSRAAIPEHIIPGKNINLNENSVGGIQNFVQIRCQISLQICWVSLGRVSRFQGSPPPFGDESGQKPRKITTFWTNSVKNAASETLETSQYLWMVQNMCSIREEDFFYLYGYETKSFFENL